MSTSYRISLFYLLIDLSVSSCRFFCVCRLYIDSSYRCRLRIWSCYKFVCVCIWIFLCMRTDRMYETHILKITFSQSHSQAHILEITFSKSHSQNHILKITFSQPHSQNHILKITLSQSHSQNHILTITFSKPHSQNHILKTTFSKSHSQNPRWLVLFDGGFSLYIHAVAQLE